MIHSESQAIPTNSVSQPASSKFSKKRILILLVLLILLFSIALIAIIFVIYNKDEQDLNVQPTITPTPITVTVSVSPTLGISTTPDATIIPSATISPTNTIIPTNSIPLNSFSKSNFSMNYPASWNLDDKWNVGGYDNASFTVEGYTVVLYRYPAPAEHPCLFSDTPTKSWESNPDIRRINLRNTSYKTLQGTSFSYRIARDKLDDDYQSNYYNESDNLHDYVACTYNSGIDTYEDTIPAVGVFVYSIPSNASSTRLNEIYAMLQSIKLK